MAGGGGLNLEGKCYTGFAPLLLEETVPSIGKLYVGCVFVPLSTLNLWTDLVGVASFLFGPDRKGDL